MADATRKPKGSPYARTGGYAHRLVLLVKIGPGEHPCHWCRGMVSWGKSYPKDLNGLCVDHLDGDKRNNDPSNLVPSHGICNARRARLERAERERRERRGRPRQRDVKAVGWPPAASSRAPYLLDDY